MGLNLQGSSVPGHELYAGVKTEQKMLVQVKWPKISSNKSCENFLELCISKEGTEDYI